MKTRIFMIMFCVMLIYSVAQADVSVPTMFSDHAVLQRNISVPVWGTASPYEEVTVDFNGQLKTTAASASGDWMITLEPMPVSSSASDMVITGDNVVTITDVQVGEVWVGSGQSNMYNPLSGDCDASDVIPTSGNPNIRFFNVGSGTPEGTIWEVCTPETSPSFSAVHFYFGRHLAQEMPNVPIGLIHSAVSATAIEKWATCAGSGGLYLDQIKPLQPYAIRGATWYQGEWDSRNARDAEKYYWQMPCLIDEWRTDWGQDPLDFPFYIVQMPKMGLSSIHMVRDAELQTALGDPKIEMIVTIDIEGHDVHPPCKKEFGFRLALLALEFEYGLINNGRSPFYNAGASSVINNTIEVVFDDVAGGLKCYDAASGLACGNHELAEWEIAGSDGNYVAAEAVIKGTDTVEVWSSDVPNPVSARYAYSTNPAANNLINSAGLPASPIKEVIPESGGPVCDDGICDAGEDQCNCAADCGTPPSTETSCADGDDNDCDGYIDCDDLEDCSGDLVACPDCLPKGAACTDDADCCSGRCLPAGKCAN